MRLIFKYLETHFHIFIVLVALLGLFFPEAFQWVQPYIKQILGGIMFCMGATLKFTDFKGVFKTPKLIFIGVILQYSCMPILAYLISKLLQLPTEQLIGLIIVGCCPGGTASNLITYLAKGNVALSVTLTLVSTLLSPLLTPIILFWFLNEAVPIDVFTLMKSIFWIVVFPIMDALLIRHFFEKQFQKAVFIFPSLAIILISLLVGFIIGSNKTLLLALPVVLFIAIVLHNGFGYLLGYHVSRIFGVSSKDAKTIAIEVGMQNSGLGLALANQFFNVAVALPSALFSIWHNLSGVLLAKFWRKNSN